VRSWGKAQESSRCKKPLRWWRLCPGGARSVPHEREKCINDGIRSVLTSISNRATWHRGVMPPPVATNIDSRRSP